MWHAISHSSIINQAANSNEQTYMAFEIHISYSNVNKLMMRPSHNKLGFRVKLLSRYKALCQPYCRFS